MDDRTKEILNGLLNRLPKDLTSDELAFIKARRDYLTKTQLLDFDIINENQTKPLERTENGKSQKTNPRRVNKN